MSSQIMNGQVPGARFIDPSVLARISNLELLARTVVEGFINGLHRSPHLGSSMDFAEHRAYMPGDDIRRIDWKLYARSDKYFIKEFEADTNVNFSILLDISKSMNFSGTPNGFTKLDYAKYMAACLAYFSSKQRDRVGMITFDDDLRDYIPPSAKHLHVILHALDRIKAGRKGNLDRPMVRLAEHFRRRSLLVVISDFYDEPRNILEAVSHLKGKGNDVIVMHVLDKYEIEFPYDDASNFQDLESDEKIPIVPYALRDKYQKLVQDHVASLGTLFSQNRIDYTLFNTSQPLDSALFSYLSNRERLMRVR
jgi:uncharacterized protein (DUF58 family)